MRRVLATMAASPCPEIAGTGSGNLASTDAGKRTMQPTTAATLEESMSFLLRNT